MSQRTARQSAAFDSYRAVRAREAAILRAQTHRRVTLVALCVLLTVALIVGAGVVCTLAIAAET